MDRNELITFIGSMTGHKNIIGVPRVFVELTGDWGVAAMLNQLIYWSSRSNRSDGYIYKSVAEWEKEVGGITKHTVGKLRELPFVETKLMKANGAPTTHYKIDFEILIGSICEKRQIQLPETANPSAENGKSLTETTTDTTAEIKKHDNVKDFGETEPRALAVYDDDGELVPLEDRMIEVFCDRVGLYNGNRPFEHKPTHRSWYADWLRDVGKLIELDVSSAEMEEAVALLKHNDYSVKRPGALIDTIKNIRADRIKFDAGEKNKLHRYKLKKVSDVSTNRTEYLPVDWWEEREGVK